MALRSPGRRLGRYARRPHAAIMTADSVRKRARHGVLDAIRREIGVTESMKPEGYFNPFDGTAFAARYRELHPPRETDRPPVGP
jgi:hypothetical protein